VKRVEPVRSEGTTMIYLAAIIALFLFVYLFTALIRPEWF
jgi:K+-transporting ATPase KdpF subunit